MQDKKFKLLELEITFYITIFVGFLLDQLSKLTVHYHLKVGESIPLIKNILHLTYVRNTGAAFSLFAGFSFYLAIIGIIIATVVFCFHVKTPITNFFVQMALAFILGGSLGNLVDRILRGYVIDFIDFRVWPVFNLADIMINFGVIILAIQLLRRK